MPTRSSRAALSALAAAAMLATSAISCHEDAASRATGSTAADTSASGLAAAVPSLAPSGTPSATASPPVPDGMAPSESSSRAPWEPAEIAKPTEQASDRLVGGSARRATVRAAVDDAVLRANPELLTAHFGPSPPFPLTVQRALVHGGREAVLVTSAKDDVVPLVILADATGKALWTKRRPLAGTRENVRGLGLVAGPEGSIAIAWWDEPTKAVAFRRWDFDGSVFADYHLFDADGCDGLDAVYWPDHGWIITVSMLADGVARSTLITESGLGGFGGSVLEVTSSERVTSKTVAAVGIDGIFYAYLGLSRHASPASQRSSVWVNLRREDGSAPWKSPAGLGRAPQGKDPAQLVPALTLETPAILRVEVEGDTFRVGPDGRPIRPLGGAAP